LQQDGIETLQWIPKQPWFDGHISELHDKRGIGNFVCPDFK